MTWADGSGVEMASTNFAERDETNHFVAYYRDDYARLCRIAKSTINTHPVYTIYQCSPGEDVDSTALTRENDVPGTLHAVYRVTDASGYRIEYKSSVDDGQTWSSPASVIYDEEYAPLMNYVGIVVDNNGVLHVTYADMKWTYYTYSEDGINWSEPDNLFFMNPAPISLHFTQPYLLCTGDTLHLFYIVKLTPSQYGDLRWVYKPLN
jgi:hypothetical protein